MAKFLDDLLNVLASRVAIIVLGISKVIIIARWLGPEMNGTISALLVYPSIFISFGALGLRRSSAFFIGKQMFEEGYIKQAIVQIWLISSIFSIVACFLLIRFFSSSGDNLIYIFLAILPIPFSLLISYISGIFLGKNQIKASSRIDWLPAIFTLLSTIAFVIIVPYSVTGALIADAVGPIIMCAILLKENNILRFFELRVNKKILGSLLSLGMVYALSLVVLNLNYRIDTVMLDKMSTSYEVGIYSKGSVMIQYLWQIPMMLGTIVFARSATAKDSNAFSLKVCQLMRLSLIIIGIGCVILSLLSGFIISILFGPAFAESASSMALLAPGVLLLTIFKVLNMDISGRGAPMVAVRAMLPALGVNIASNYFLIPLYGADGAAMSSTISYSFGALYFLLIYSRFTGIGIKTIFGFSWKDFEVFSNLVLKFMPKRSI